MFQELLSLTKILVAIPTVTGDEASLDLAIEIAYQDLYDYNVQRFKTSNISSLLYYNTDKIPEKFRILLNTNLDVVTAKPSQFKPICKENKLFGRGTYDMKAASAAMILAFKEAAKKVDYPLGLQIVADEEIGGNSTKYQIDQGVRADFVVCATPTDLGISHMSKGMLWMKIKTQGKATHSSSPWKGENAVWKMKQFLDKLEKAFPVPQADSWITTVNLARLTTSNEEFNNVPDNCEAWLDIRYIPADETTIIDRIKNLAPKDFSLEVILNDLSESTPLDNPDLKTLSSSFEKVTGKESRIIKKNYADAVRNYKPFGGHGACIGPIGAGAHEDDEWVDMNSVVEYYKILKDFLLSVK